MRLKSALALVSIAMAIAVVSASVFVYYPVSLNLSPVKPPIYFVLGDNANQNDLGGSGSPYSSNVIEVSLDAASTSLSITVHPTYQTTYYKSLAKITNQDGKAYYVAFRVTDPLSDTKITEAKLLIYSGSTLVATVDLTSTGDTSWVSLSAGTTWRIDFKIVVSSTGGSYDNPPSISDTTAALQLIYSTQNSEAAPTPP